MSSRLSKLPSFLRESTGAVGDEPIEGIKVNTINLVAALIDKIQESGNYQNDWSDPEKYVPQFHLNEVMQGLVGKFDITDPKMLKGFLNSKGTISDLRYVTKMIGIELDIRESDYYATLGIINGLHTDYNSLFPDILDRDLTDEMILEWMGERIRYADNVNLWYADNVDPYYVINFNRSSYEILELMGYKDPSPAQVLAFDDIYGKYLAAVESDPDTLACSISVFVNYDMDSPSYDPDTLRNLSELFKVIAENRLLPHIRIQGYQLNLRMYDILYINKIKDEDLTGTITLDLNWVDKVEAPTDDSMTGTILFDPNWIDEVPSPIDNDFQSSIQLDWKWVDHVESPTDSRLYTNITRDVTDSFAYQSLDYDDLLSQNLMVDGFGIYNPIDDQYYQGSVDGDGLILTGIREL